MHLWMKVNNMKYQLISANLNEICIFVDLISIITKSLTLVDNRAHPCNKLIRNLNCHAIFRDLLSPKTNSKNATIYQRSNQEQYTIENNWYTSMLVKPQSTKWIQRCMCKVLIIMTEIYTCARSNLVCIVHLVACTIIYQNCKCNIL